MHHWWNADPSQCGRWDGAPSPTLKNRIAGWFHSLTLGTRPGKLKAGSWRDACTSMLIAECFKTAKRWRWTKCPSADEQMNKTWYIHTMQYYSTSREKEVLTHAAAWMNFWGRCAKGQKPATKKKKKKHWFQFYEALRVPVIYRDRKQNGGSKGRSGRERWYLIHRSRVSFLWDEKSSVDGLRWW